MHTLQEALLAKRGSEQGQALAASLERAIALVDAFREQPNQAQDAKAFSRLKEEVRRAMVPQVGLHAPRSTSCLHGGVACSLTQPGPMRRPH